MIARFDMAADGQEVQRITFGTGPLTASVLTWGAALQDLRLAGYPHGLTIGFDRLAPYQGDFYHAGTIMGPVANRIAHGRAMIDGREYRFDRNFLGRHTLHGGSAATHARIWQIADHGPDHVTLTTTLPDGEGGFPGNRRIAASFTTDGAALSLTLDAETDAPTILNLANHSYWNLAAGPTTAGHLLQIHADRYTPTDARLIPTGQIAPVAGTRFDYRQPRAILAGAEGPLDLNFCLADARRPLAEAARLCAPGGPTMTMETTEPGLQLFDGHVLGYRGLALEAQFWPDAPNNPNFPDITLRPGQSWRQRTIWRFTEPRPA